MLFEWLSTIVKWCGVQGACLERLRHGGTRITDSRPNPTIENIPNKVPDVNDLWDNFYARLWHNMSLASGVSERVCARECGWDSVCMSICRAAGSGCVYMYTCLWRYLNHPNRSIKGWHKTSLTRCNKSPCPSSTWYVTIVAVSRNGNLYVPMHSWVLNAQVLLWTPPGIALLLAPVDLAGVQLQRRGPAGHRYVWLSYIASEEDRFGGAYHNMTTPIIIISSNIKQLFGHISSRNRSPTSTNSS